VSWYLFDTKENNFIIRKHVNHLVPHWINATMKDILDNLVLPERPVADRMLSQRCAFAVPHHRQTGTRSVK